MTRASVTYANSRSADNMILADYSKIDPLLVELLSLCTPHGTEHHIAKIIAKQEYIGNNDATLMFDKTKGNVIVRVGDEAESNLFSSHMDIVGENHKNNLEKGFVENIFLMTPDPALANNELNYGIIYGAKRYTNKGVKEFKPSTLGADDKVGVWIMLKMIEKKIPGLYIFHTGEERGAVGSRHLAEHHKHLFKPINRAIAFDRAGYADVIAHQRGQRCSSTEFSKALAEQLNRKMPPKSPFVHDIRGMFTDTASYVDLVAECCNISVGYFNQHGDGEHLDVYWLQQMLLPAILQVNWNELPVERDPTKKEYSYSSNYNNNAWINKERKTWEEATEFTNYLEFPLWEPKLAHLPDVDPKVVKKAMENYVNKLTFQEKKDFIETLYGLYAINDALVEGMIDKDRLIEKLDKNKKKAAVKLDIQIPTKKGFLNRLVELAANTVITEERQDQWLRGYILGANHWLHSNQERNTADQYSEKELLKLNRLIYAIATILDIWVSTDAGQDILDKIEEYITKHPEEEGWILSKQHAEMQSQTTFNKYAEKELEPTIH